MNAVRKADDLSSVVREVTDAISRLEPEPDPEGPDFQWPSFACLSLGSVAAVGGALFGYSRGGGLIAGFCAFFCVMLSREGLLTLLIEFVFRQRSLRESLRACLSLGFSMMGGLVLGAVSLVMLFLRG